MMMRRIGNATNGEDIMSVHSFKTSVDGDFNYFDEDEGSTTKKSGRNLMNNRSNNVGVEIAREENRALSRMKVIVLLFLMTLAIITSLFVNMYLKNNEEYSFEEDYEEYVLMIYNAIDRSLQLSLGALKANAVGVASHVRAFNDTWPYVTVPDFMERSMEVLVLSKGFQISQAHFVTSEQREKWENYTANNNAWWLETQRNELRDQKHSESYMFDHIEDRAKPSDLAEIYLPVWQQYPVLGGHGYNYDLLQAGLCEKENFVSALMSENASSLLHIHHPLNSTEIADDHSAYHFLQHSAADDSMSNDDNTNKVDPTEPIGILYYPIFSNLQNTSKSVAVISVAFRWRRLLEDILSDHIGSQGLVTVFENTCNGTFTYRIDGPEVVYLGKGDLHEPKYDYLKDTMSLPDLVKTSSYQGQPLYNGTCDFNVSIYASQSLHASYHTNVPLFYSFGVVSIFLFTSMIFLLYDCYVERRQAKVMRSAQQTSAIVSSLFPSNVRDRLFQNNDNQQPGTSRLGTYQPIKNRMKTFLEQSSSPSSDDRLNQGTVNGGTGMPIADFFPDASVFFADIAGFTAWSSMREPTQVFVFLEAVYGKFDAIADRRKVFKVETIGDCYVAVCGVPEPRKDHAIVICKFAFDCRRAMVKVTQNLQVRLGPDTGDLQLRFGINSGPVTAGVLRGARSRFQLFGDTVNTAARMESNGKRNKIHVSQATADLISKANKSHWLIKREDLIEAKGKGTMQTYWVEPSSDNDQEPKCLEVSSNHSVHLCSRKDRLVSWACDVFDKMVCDVIARRELCTSTNLCSVKTMSSDLNCKAYPLQHGRKKTVLDEVKDVIELPSFNTSITKLSRSQSPPGLNKVERLELEQYVSKIARLYKDNPFHNFEHATHVTMSVVKLLSRIVAPDVILNDLSKMNTASPSSLSIANSLHDHTYGITSDPLTQLACVFSALIHDLDHPGVPNTQLIKENESLSAKYNGKSVAEQNSFDIAWELLMQDEFTNLRKIICETESEMRRFRQLVINCVMATDIMDKDLQKRRSDKWREAFYNDNHDDRAECNPANNQININRKATIVLEHIIQASDIAHTMQHWHVYRMWNERLFQEMYLAFKMGRLEKDPSDIWYQGELGFFDHYILPLTKKLHECGVFGVSSQEYMSYATKNRDEWESKGREIVMQMVDSMQSYDYERLCEAECNTEQ